MSPAVKRRYDNTRRQAQSQATRASIINAARAQFTEHGYPAATLEAIAAAAGTSLPTLYRLFSSKRGLLKAVLDVTLGGDDQPIAFGDRAEVQAARAQTDPAQLIAAFAPIMRDFMDRSAPILHVLATAAPADPDAAQLAAEIRRQRHTGQSRIITALSNLGALDPDLDLAEATDIAYAILSPDVHRILTAERGWTGDQYQRWLTRSLGSLLRHPPAQETPAGRATAPAG
jgi:AcrR family transcriptional regulator